MHIIAAEWGRLEYWNERSPCSSSLADMMTRRKFYSMAVRDNQVRPHSALGYLTPAEFAQRSGDVAVSEKSIVLSWAVLRWSVHPADREMYSCSVVDQFPGRIVHQRSRVDRSGGK